MKGEPGARKLAHTTLLALAQGQYSNLAVDAMLRRSELSAADKRLYTALVYGVVERQTTLDFLLSRFSKRPLSDLTPKVLFALRLGLYQLVYLDKVPDYASVNHTVSLVSQQARGYVNAILHAYLRSVAERPREKNLMTPGDWCERFPELQKQAHKAQSVAYGLPEPLCRLFAASLGEETGSALMEGLCHRPPVTLRVNTLRAQPGQVMASLAAAGFSPQPGIYAPEAIRVDGGTVASLPAFAAGEFFVQDEASQLCVKALDARPGDVVVDVCAAPGSKSFGAALCMQNQGHIYDFDLHDSKLSLIRSGAERLGITILSAAARDGRTPDTSLLGQADRVLCDVPCSGLGVIAKKPEIRHKDLSTIERLPAIQRKILEASAGYLKPGGVLVYATCTVLPTENQMVVQDFLSAHEGEFLPEEFEFRPLTPGVGATVTSRGGMVTLYPHTSGTDGFFIARMRKALK